MIVQHKDRTLLHIYACGICGENYLKQTGDFRVSCAVHHQPGTCCHYGEKRVDVSQMNMLHEFLDSLEGEA